MEKEKDGVLHLIWTARFDTSLPLNLFVCIVTYAILLAYCLLCLHTGTLFEENKDHWVVYQLQFYMDAFFPSTLTLVISIIIQNITEGFKKSGVTWSLTAVVIAVTVIYSMVCSALRIIKGVGQFIALGSFTAGLLVLCFFSIAQIQLNAEKPSGISRKP